MLEGIQRHVGKEFVQMIQLIGDDTSGEYEAASELRRLIIRHWPQIEADTRSNIWIIAGAKCHGQRVRDIDILLLANFGTRYVYQPFLSFFALSGQLECPNEVVVKSLCLAIEVKNHTSDKISFIGTRTRVLYKGKWKDASEQNEQQIYSIKNYLTHHGLKSPQIVPLLWLRNVQTVDLPSHPHNILGSNLVWSGVLNVVGQQRAPMQYHSSWELSCGEPGTISQAAALFAKPSIPSTLDRRRMEAISQKSTDVDALMPLIGNSVIVLRGGGGTGKTLRLLQLAKLLYDFQDARIVLLTYNKALVADIRRLLTFVGIGSDIAEHSIQIQTAHSFFWSLLRSLGVFDPKVHDFIREYEGLKDEALSYYGVGALTQDDLRLEHEVFSWDYVFVDEGQDWPQNEQEILLKIYPHKRFVIADGVDQLIRSSKPANWKKQFQSARLPSRYQPLRTCIRMKAGLAQFVTSFAQNLGLPLSNWEANNSAPGGRVIIIDGDYLSKRDLHVNLLGQNTRDDNKPVDMLFCVSSNLVLHSPENGEAYSQPSLTFSQWGYPVWDGVSVEARESYPTDLNQLRIVQYDSCRGLEGWIVVNLDFDGFYMQKMEQYKTTSSIGSTHTLMDIQKEAHLYATRWLLMPLTRAMDTLVIQISKQPSVVREALMKTAFTHKDLVEWR